MNKWLKYVYRKIILTIFQYSNFAVYKYFFMYLQLDRGVLTTTLANQKGFIREG